MLTRIFGQITSATSIFIAIYALVLCGVHFYMQQPLAVTLETEYGIIVFNRYVAWVLYVALLLILIYGFQFLIFTKYKLLKHNAYLPYFLLPVMLIWLPYGGLTLLAQSVIFLFILQQWLRVYQGDNILSSSLNTGFLVGLGSLIHTEFWLLLALGFVVYTIYGRFSFRTFLIPIIGYLTVWINLLAIEFLLTDSALLLDGFQSHFSIEKESMSMVSMLPLYLLGILTLPGLYEFTFTIGRASVFKKQSYIIMALVLIVAVIAFMVFGAQSFPFAIGIPVIAIFFANFLQYLKKNWMVEIILWLFIVVFGIFESGWL